MYHTGYEQQAAVQRHSHGTDMIGNNKLSSVSVSTAEDPFETVRSASLLGDLVA
jgi:hypothetical protein